MEAPNFPVPPPPSAKEKKENAEKDGKERLKEMYAKLRELWPEYKAKVTTTTQGTVVGAGAASQTPATASAA